MTTYRFRNAHDVNSTINALRVAAERFDENARVMAETFRQDHPITRQFLDQAAEARRIANDLEAMD